MKQYLVIPISEIDSRIEELDKERKTDDSPLWRLNLSNIIHEIKELKSKGEIVEIQELSNTPYGISVSIDELEDKGFKLIKTIKQ